MNRFIPWTHGWLFFILFFLATNAVGGVIRVPYDHESIQGAIDAAALGDTILVEGPRVYRGGIVLKSRITLGGDHGRPVLHGSVTADGVEGVTLENVIVDGTGLLNQSGIYCSRSEIRFKGCASTNGYYGFYVNEESDVRIDSCVIESSWLDGILIRDSRVAISHSILRENSIGPTAGNTYGFSALDGSRVDMSHCRIVHNERGIRINGSEADIRFSISAFNEDDGLSLSNGADCDVDHCTISYNGYRDVMAFPGVMDSEIRNSILWNDHNSIFDQTGIPIRYSVIPEPTGGTGNLSFSPFFVDGPNGDFRLRSNSVCIDRGEPDVLDPDGTRTDMGALFFDQRDYDPPPPSFISAVGEEHRVILSWPYLWENFLDHFNIYRSEVSGFPPGAENLVAQVEPGEQSYTDDGLTNEVTYYYRIKSVYRLGYESPPTEEIEATPGIAPELVVDPPLVDFGSVVAGSSKEVAVMVSNTGNGVLHVGGIDVSGSTVFTINTETPFELDPEEGRSILVRFQPPLPVSYSGQMEIAYTSVEGRRYVPLTGRGVADVFALPNPFTPNGDGYNDYVSFELPPHERFGIRIFDVSGREVRHLRTPDPRRWHGEDRGGEDALPGVYIYVVTTDGETVASGTITLIR